MSSEKSLTPQIRFKGFTEAWEQRKLSDIADRITTISNDSCLPRVEYEDINSGFGTLNKNLQNKKSLKTGVRFQAGDCLYGKLRPYLMNWLNPQFNGIAVGDFWVLRPSSSNEAFLYSFIQSDAFQFNANISCGSKMPRADWSLVSEAYYFIPSSVDEQKFVGVLFKQTDSLITLHQRKLDALKKIKSALLEKMFPKDGSDIPEIRFAGFTEAWEQRKVFEIANRLDNLRVPVASNLRIPGNTPYYGANGIQDYVSGYTHDGEFVLVAEDGANDLKNYPVQYVSGQIWVNNHAHVLQGLERVIDNRFLSFSLVRCDIEVLLVGGGRSKLNANTLMNELTLSLPNLNEQKNIGELFFKLDDLITLHQRKLDALKKIKSALLEKMFV